MTPDVPFYGWRWHFLIKMPVQPSFAPSQPGNNAGTLASGKFLYKTLPETSYP